MSKLLGKWTIDKRTSGESKGSSGSYSENYDVLGRELMLEYELRLLPDDECIIFVRGENPIRDKKWFPWEHEEYLEARKCGVFNPSVQKEIQEKQMEECQFVNEESVEYLKKQKEKNENIRLYGMDAFSFMMIDLDGLEKKILQSLLRSMYGQKRMKSTLNKRKMLNRDIAVVEILFSTGIRISELCDLKQKSIDLEQGIFFIKGKGEVFTDRNSSSNRTTTRI